MFLSSGENWVQFAQNQLKIPLNKIKLIHNWTATSDLLKLGNKKHQTIYKPQ